MSVLECFSLKHYFVYSTEQTVITVWGKSMFSCSQESISKLSIAELVSTITKISKNTITKTRPTSSNLGKCFTVTDRIC